MSDLISRAAAVKAIRKCKFDSDMPSDWYRGMESAQDIVEGLPSAEPKAAEWTNAGGEPIKDKFCVYCSKCKAWSEYRTNFCPNCGADMSSSRRPRL